MKQNKQIDLLENALRGHRISKEDALNLYRHAELPLLQHYANKIRETLHKDLVRYSTCLFLYPTNFCENCCPLCSFYAPTDSSKGWFFSPNKLLENFDSTFQEVHIVGGLYHKCNLPYYQELFSKIKEKAPHIHIKALSAVEYDYLARLHNTSIESILKSLQLHGLGSIPGGGAEILDDSVRKKIAPKKTDSQRFLEIHKTAHKLDIPTNITMLFSHIESDEHIIDHLDQIRTLQDSSGGFSTFIPLKFHAENNLLGKKFLQPKDPYRIFAISRLMLDNVPHIKTLWNYFGVDSALQLLDYGANDFSSTNSKEQVVLTAGAKPVPMDENALKKLLQSKKRTTLSVHSGA